VTVTEALTQCAMHSHYHRAQNATRLRELGGGPAHRSHRVVLEGLGLPGVDIVARLKPSR
jgi:hypothetical protein